MLSLGFVMVHDTKGGGHDQMSELTRWQQVVDPFFVLVQFDVETRTDDSALVDASTQFNHNLS